MDLRTQLLNDAYNQHIPTADISQALNYNKLKPLNRYEQYLINSGKNPTDKGVGQFISTLGQSTKDLASGFGTVAGGVAKSFAEGSIYRKAYEAGKSAVKNPKGVGKLIVDTITSPYYPGRQGSEVIKGYYKNENPVQATLNVGKDYLTGLRSGNINAPLDALSVPFVGPKLGGALLKGARVVGNVAEDVARTKGGAIGNKFADLFPSARMNDVNQTISEAGSKASMHQYNLQKQVTDLLKQKDKTGADLTQAVRNVTVGTNEGTEATKNLTKSLKDLSNSYIKELEPLGLGKEEQRTATVGQYMQDTLNPNRDKNISLADLYSGNPKKLQQAGINPEDATRAFIKGNNLYETGDIVPISARGVAKNIQSDLERSIELGKGAKSNVELGLTSSKEKAEGLQKSYDILNKNISTALEADNALSNTARRFGTKVDITKPIELGKDETVISPKLFHDNIGKTVTADRASAVEDLIKKVQSDKVTPQLLKGMKEYADDLYVVKKADMRALANSFGRIGREDVLTRISSPLKSNMLATVRYLIGNVLGDTSLNMIEGVRPTDYLDAIKLNTQSALPGQLIAQTGYQGIVGGEPMGKLGDAYRRAIEIIKDPNYDAIDKLGSATRAINAPITIADVNQSLLQRGANMIRQAKRLAQGTKYSWQDIIKEAKTNDDLYMMLNKDVKGSLGDYAGRNYYLPNWARSSMGNIAMFYKYPQTSVGAMTRGFLLHGPMANLLFRMPSNYGTMYNKQQEQQTGIKTNDFGGVISKLPVNRFSPAQVISGTFQPYQAGIEALTKPGEAFGNVTPVFDYLKQAEKYQNAFGQPASGNNTINIKGTLYVMDNNGNVTGEIKQPTGFDKAKYGMALFGKNFVAPIHAYNQVAQIASQVSRGKLKYYKPYDIEMFPRLGRPTGMNIYKGPMTPRDIYLHDLNSTVQNVYNNTKTRATGRDMKAIRRKMLQLQRQRGE